MTHGRRGRRVPNTPTDQPGEPTTRPARMRAPTGTDTTVEAGISPRADKVGATGQPVAIRVRTEQGGAAPWEDSKAAAAAAAAAAMQPCRAWPWGPLPVVSLGRIRSWPASCWCLGVGMSAYACVRVDVLSQKDRDNNVWQSHDSGGGANRTRKKRLLAWPRKIEHQTSRDWCWPCWNMVWSCLSSHDTCAFC